VLVSSAVKIVATPLLIGGASLAGRRWGHQVGGWLVALPLTSGPVAFFLAVDHGAVFAGQAAIGMMAGTVSQVAFALAYRGLAVRGWPAALAAGSTAFAATTLSLAALHWSALPTFGLVLAVLGSGIAVIRTRRARTTDTHPGGPGRCPGGAASPRWDIPVRMAVASAVVLTITAVAPVIGPHPAGLLSPFPVFGAVLAVFTHRGHGPAASSAALDGLVMGLAAPAVFFLALATTLPDPGPDVVRRRCRRRAAHPSRHRRRPARSPGPPGALIRAVTRTATHCPADRPTARPPP
jgi:hypothetical protein